VEIVMRNERLYIKFLESGALGEIELYWENAPITCDRIWNALATPITGEVNHHIYSGPGVSIGLNGTARNFDPLKVPRENQGVSPAAGELVWFYQPAHFFNAMPEECWEVAIFYEPGAHANSPAGVMPSNHFGRIVKGFPEIAKSCRAIRREGIKIAEFGRLT
jgi:hypothetical protein